MHKNREEGSEMGTWEAGIAEVALHEGDAGSGAQLQASMAENHGQRLVHQGGRPSGVAAAEGQPQLGDGEGGRRFEQIQVERPAEG